MIQDVRNDKVIKIYIDAYENRRAVKLYGVVVQCMQNLLVFKLDFKKIFLIVKLSEALKNLTGLTTACMIQDVGNDQVFQIFIDAYQNPRAMKLHGVVVQCMQNLLVFKLDFKKIFLIVKLSEALKSLTGLTTACMIQDVGNEQVFQIFIDAYENRKAMKLKIYIDAYENCRAVKLYGVVVQCMQNLLVFKLDFKKIFLIVKLSEALKNLTGLTTACMIQDVGNDQVFQIFIDAYENPRAMKLHGVVVQCMQNLLVFKLDFKKIFLIVKLSEALKSLTGLTTACMIQDVGNEQVFQIFIDAYENRKAMKLYGVVVQCMQNLLVFKLES